MIRRLAPVIGVVLLTACAAQAPPSLSPAGVRVWQANEVVIALGTVQRAAIALNGVSRCELPPNETRCTPLLSEANTRVVVEAVTDALTAIKATPAGWKAVALAALDSIDQRLDSAGKARVVAYVRAARSIVDVL